MNFLKRIFAAVVLSVGVLTVVPAVAVGAAPLDEVCEGDTTSSVCQDTDANVGGVMQIIINTLLFLVGAISVVMIIVGGIRYTTSGGDSSGVTAAKNTIMYAIIGLVVSVIAYAVVNWVLDLF